MKPDIVFFGEGLPDVFHRTLEQDKLTVRHHYVYAHVLVVTFDKTQSKQLAFAYISIKVYNISIKKQVYISNAINVIVFIT